MSVIFCLGFDDFPGLETVRGTEDLLTEFMKFAGVVVGEVSICFSFCEKLPARNTVETVVVPESVSFSESFSPNSLSSVKVGKKFLLAFLKLR